MADGIDWTLDTRKLDALIASNPDDLEQMLTGVAEEMVSDIKLGFNTGPAGREYRRGKKLHVASVGGYPPNVDMGTLRASIRQRRAGKLVRHIEDGVDYGLHLELGTEAIAPRPFVRPVFEVWRQGKFAQFAVTWGLLK